MELFVMNAPRTVSIVLALATLIAAHAIFSAVDYAGGPTPAHAEVRR